MYQVNLLPWQEQQLQQRYHVRLVWFIAQFLTLLCLLLFIKMQMAQHVKQQEQQASQLNQEERHWKAQHLQITQALAALKNAQLAQQQRLHQQKTTQAYVRLLEQLPIHMPASLWLTALEQHDKHVMLKGISDDLPALQQFMTDLTQINALKNIKLSQVNATNTGQQQFTLLSNWHPDEPSHHSSVAEHE